MLINTRHHSLIAWQRADDLFIKLHLLTLKEFPNFEKFELGSQLRKAAYSMPANIVEGFARRSRKARLNFLNIAEASLAEVGYCVHVAHRLGYIDDDLLGTLEKDLNGVGAPLTGLVRSTSVDLTLSVLCLAAAAAAMAWFAGVTDYPADPARPALPAYPALLDFSSRRRSSAA
jgi:four helix bundle protein